VSPYARRYPVRVMLRARELALADWSAPRIAKIIGQETGMRPSPATVRTWLSSPVRTEEQRVSDRASHRERYRQRNAVVQPRVSDDWKVEQMRALFLRNVSIRAIGQVAAVWWGEELSAEQVRTKLGINEGGLKAARAAA
jgi:hypothetical protein